MFNSVSLDGYFTSATGDMSWAHRYDPEWSAFVSGNASGDAALAFGRKTYDLMASYWPTPLAAKNNPGVAEAMNRFPKVVFSRTLDKAEWNNTKLVKGDLATEVRKMKREPGKDMVIMGSGSIVSQLAEHGLIDDLVIELAHTTRLIGIVVGDGQHGEFHRVPHVASLGRGANSIISGGLTTNGFNTVIYVK